MGITGAVLVTPTVSAHTLTAETATFPEANMTVVKVWHGAVYLSIPLDSTRNAILPSAGGAPAGSSTVAAVGTGRAVNFNVKGTALNYSVYSVSTTPNIVFYYGTPLKFSPALETYAGIAQAATLSSGAGSLTWTFPSGPLKLQAVSATVGVAAASTGIELSWNVSSGKTMYVFVYQGIPTQMGVHNDDFFEVGGSLTVSQTVAVTLSAGTGSDIVVAYAYYS